MAVKNVAITTPLALYSLSNFKKPKNNARFGKAPKVSTAHVSPVCI